MGLKHLIAPKDHALADDLVQLGATSASCLEDLATLFANYGALAERRQRVKELEQKADQLARSLVGRIEDGAKVPYKEDDALRLVRAYAGICRSVLACVNDLYMYGVNKVSPEMSVFAKLAGEQGKALHLASEAIRSPKTLEHATNHCVEVSRLEREADRLLIQTLAALLRGNDAVQILKLKEVYEALERVTDRCEDAAEAMAAMARRGRKSG